MFEIATMIVQSLEQGMSRNVAATLVPAACVKLADTKKQAAGTFAVYLLY